MREAGSGESPVDVRLVPAALTCWLVTAAGIWWPVGRALASCCVVIAAAGVLAARAARRPGRAALRPVSVGVVAVGVVGTGFGFAIAMRADAVDRHPIAAAFGHTAPVTVTPAESAVPLGSGRLMFRATLQLLGSEAMSGRVVVFARAAEFGPETVMVGRPVRFAARIGRPARRDLTVAVLNASGSPTTGTAGVLQRAAHAVRGRFAAAVRDTLPPDQAAMLPALVLGDTSAVSPEAGRDFRSAGMTHLTAVSGANVTIVCAAVLFSARLVGPRVAVVLAAAALVAFVFVVQPTASVLRAAVMGAIALTGMLSSRRRQAIPALSATVLVLLAVAPQLAVDVGFALSVLATAALVVVAPAWSRRLVARGWPKPPADALAVACAAHLVTAPLVAAISGRFSLVAVAANLAAAPVIAPITVLGSASAALCPLWRSGAQLLIRFTGPEVWWVVHVARWAARVPAATVPVPAGVAGVLVVAGVTAAVLAMVALLRRRRWFRRAARLGAASIVLCGVAWSLSASLSGSLSGLVGPS
ncbi:ComEC/Rec2 family competence protein [Mycobacterium parmense]|uniref:Membrane protein n=1 Tax=Mycobacterium parmense TaxID=185642 RepID=A0A7I7YN41_9MYCO|nr:ComEC/Rec2 family competence protein [Mycobacterium parmense]MCV7353219.1 ComEC/Rec2 family competence protein [Mycobacterium parmense]ORW63129.1 competence protein [Mycobacterium parmense]BBZ43230.1 membrane protein [Mycobacterium parmense]